MGRGVAPWPDPGGVSCTDMTQGSSRRSCLPAGQEGGRGFLLSFGISEVCGLRRSVVVVVVVSLFYLGCNVCVKFYFDILKETKWAQIAFLKGAACAQNAFSADEGDTDSEAVLCESW